jgi:hypothetical protein
MEPMKRRTTFNPKRRFGAPFDSPNEFQELSERVRYGGNPEHKRNPGDFGLDPPIAPRPAKTLCDDAGIHRRQTAEDLLRTGIRRGLISAKKVNGWPKNVWVVTDEGVPLEAQLENQETGTYHGYPMPLDDPFRERILERWKA